RLTATRGSLRIRRLGRHEHTESQTQHTIHHSAPHPKNECTRPGYSSPPPVCSDRYCSYPISLIWCSWVSTQSTWRSSSASSSEKMERDASSPASRDTWIALLYMATALTSSL